MADEGTPKKGKWSRFKGFISSPFKGSDKAEKYEIDGKTYRKDEETCEFVNVSNSNDRLPLYAFGEKCEGKKLKEVV